MKVEEIMCGCDGYTGLVPLIKTYIQSMAETQEEKTLFEGYLKEMSDRARGVKPTAAKQIRELITSHAEYRGDSIVTPLMNKDIVKWYIS